MQVANKWAVMLEEIDNEGKGSGIWAYSKKGFYFEAMGSHTAHEDNQKDLMKVIRTLKPCNCEQCQQPEGQPESEQINTEIFTAKETIIEPEKNLEGKKLSLTWEQLQKLPNNLGEEILEDFISNYEWIKGREMTKEEAIEYLEKNPLDAEVVVYGIHGLMVSVESMAGITRVHWNIHALKDFEVLLQENEEDEIPEELYLCNGCDAMYHDEMSTDECCEGHDFRVVDKGDMGY